MAWAGCGEARQETEEGRYRIRCVGGQVAPVKTPGRRCRTCLGYALPQRQGWGDAHPLISVHHWPGLLQSRYRPSRPDLPSSRARPSVHTAAETLSASGAGGTKPSAHSGAVLSKGRRPGSAGRSGKHCSWLQTPCVRTSTGSGRLHRP